VESKGVTFASSPFEMRYEDSLKWNQILVFLILVELSCAGWGVRHGGCLHYVESGRIMS
jgi:hypothetical protein